MKCTSVGHRNVALSVSPNQWLCKYKNRILGFNSLDLLDGVVQMANTLLIRSVFNSSLHRCTYWEAPQQCPELLHIVWIVCNWIKSSSNLAKTFYSLKFAKHNSLNNQLNKVSVAIISKRSRKPFGRTNVQVCAILSNVSLINSPEQNLSLFMQLICMFFSWDFHFTKYSFICSYAMHLYIFLLTHSQEGTKRDGFMGSWAI